MKQSKRNLILKIALSAAAVALLIATAAVYSFFLPKSTKGEATVTLEFVYSNMERSFDVNLDIKGNDYTLLNLLNDYDEPLRLQVGNSSNGMLNSFLGITAGKTEYYAIYVNGVYWLTGAQEILVNSGDVYTFKLLDWKNNDSLAKAGISSRTILMLILGACGALSLAAMVIFTVVTSKKNNAE